MIRSTQFPAAFALSILLAACGGAAVPAGATSPVASTATAPTTTSPDATGITVTTTQAPAPLPAMTQSGTKLTWFGHAAFKLETPSGKVLWIDPWIQNPKNPTGKADLAAIDKGDLVLITHGHFDHVGDAVAIARKTKAKLVTTFDLGDSLGHYAGYPKEQIGFDSQGNFGGDIAFFDGEVTITFVPAIHGSTVSGQGKNADLHPGGNPGGFLIAVKNGPTIYHTGDTDLFSDMALVAQRHPVTVMLTAMGDHFTMGPDAAAQAVKLVRPAMAVPMHFGTFPVLTGTPDAFAKAVDATKVGTTVHPMAVKETLAL